MFLIIEAKVSEVFKMIYTTSEDEQLLQKIVVGMADYLHVTRYFDLKTNFTSLIQYLCDPISAGYILFHKYPEGFIIHFFLTVISFFQKLP